MTQKMPKPEVCLMVSGLLKHLSHPQRLMILCYLCEKEKCVNDLVKLCGSSQSAVSQFLNRMKAEQLIESERSGNKVFYRIKDGRIKKLVQAMNKIFC
jgi:DNA-binding transcriptional ArsR family regulator